MLIRAKVDIYGMTIKRNRRLCLWKSTFLLNNALFTIFVGEAAQITSSKLRAR
ncbi:hypothetical protein HYC85_000225 [Camellia sinensis]|uniref:Uncharacterized protein n=1 Tax=Camellia sinensis TaxID=4442 RepID=A0A7J7I3I1_CAMSI|nr:hypothetical protein HYC85_000225 [Camellia sinensis]